MLVSFVPWLVHNHAVASSKYHAWFRNKRLYTRVQTCQGNLVRLHCIHEYAVYASEYGTYSARSHCVDTMSLVHMDVGWILSLLNADVTVRFQLQYTVEE